MSITGLAKREKHSVSWPILNYLRVGHVSDRKVSKEPRVKASSVQMPKVVSAYKRLTHPTSLPMHRLFSNNFPLLVKKSVDDFTQRNNVSKFQHDLLSLLPFYPHADAAGRCSKVLRTEVSPGHFINEFVIYPNSENMNADAQGKAEGVNHLIMIHGYGSGLGLYLKNFDSIASQKNWVIHAVDLLGYGCSSRPPFNPQPRNLDGVEKWFHDSFEQWLHKRNLHTVPKENIMVVAHSMGAYLMATYEIKKAQIWKKLIMVSPGAIIRHRKKIDIPKYFQKLWEQNISPFTLVRGAGPLGSKVVSGWSSRRFANLNPTERDLLHKYTYGIFQSPGSGEYMLNYLLAPGADARFPLIERGVHKIKSELLWCYGKEDWMDKKGGELVSNIVNNLHDNEQSKVVEIPDSGHHLYLDNYEFFNDLVIKEMCKFS